MAARIAISGTLRVWNPPVWPTETSTAVPAIPA